MSKGDAKVKKQKTKDKKDESLGVKNGKEKNKSANIYQAVFCKSDKSCTSSI